MRALLFPGQGSQKVGMGKALADALPSVRALYEEADQALGFALSKLCFDGPEAELQKTAVTQPAILATSIAALHALEEIAGVGIESAGLVAGHSLGEYSALVAAGALTFADAVRLVHLRGRFMQEAVPVGQGAMAAVIGLDAAAVEEICREAREGAPPTDGSGGEPVCSPANFNGGGQVVIAGHRASVERAMDLAKAGGAKLVKALPVSAPFHCALMAPAAVRLQAELERVRVREPRTPVVTNVEAAPNRDAARVKELLVRQVTAPVRWEESVRRMAELGATEAIEVGPGRVLSGLVRRIAPSIKVSAVETPADAAAMKEAPGNG